MDASEKSKLLDRLAALEISIRILAKVTDKATNGAVTDIAQKMKSNAPDVSAAGHKEKDMRNAAKILLGEPARQKPG